jgi:hypothetical protein
MAQRPHFKEKVGVNRQPLPSSPVTPYRFGQILPRPDPLQLPSNRVTFLMLSAGASFCSVPYLNRASVFWRAFLESLGTRLTYAFGG